MKTLMHCFLFNAGWSTLGISNFTKFYAVQKEFLAVFRVHLCNISWNIN